MKFRFFTLLLFSSCCFAYIQIPSVTLQTSDQETKGIDSSLPRQTVTKKQIQAFHPSTISELLRQSTDLVIQDLNGDNTRSSISMRGFGDNAAQNALILINGQPFTNPDLGTPDLNLLPISNVDRIETMQNSQSILYGDQAVGGVINIITSSPTKPVKKVNMSYGSFAAKNIQGEIADSFKNGVGYDLNLGHFASNHYRSHNEEQRNYAMLNLSYNDATTSSYLNFENINQDLQFPGILTREQVKQNRRQTRNYNDKENTNNSIIMFGVSKQVTTNWKTKVDGSILYGNGRGITTFLNTPYKFNKKRRNFFIRPEISGNFNLSKITIKPIFGLTLKNSQYQYKSSVYQSKDAQNQLAAFSLFNIPFCSKWELTTGARAAKSLDRINSASINKSYNNQVFITSIGLHYHLTSYWQAYIRRAGNYRFPKVDEDTLTQNNKPLKTQTGASYELGSSWKAKKLTLLAQLYQLDLKNEIEYIPLINSVLGF